MSEVFGVGGRFRFADRRDAGRRLAARLAGYTGRADVVVLGLPRGGVPVAFEVARALRAPLDVFLVRKLGVPGHEELAMGAIASGGVRVLNADVVSATGIGEEEIERASARELQTLRRQELAYRGDRRPVEVEGRCVVLVDDGLATGATMRAAIAALRDRGAGAIVVAVPTAPPETCEALRSEVDDVVCAITPDPFMAVGLWYRNFSPVSDQEVRDLLDAVPDRRDAVPDPGGSALDPGDSAPDPRTSALDPDDSADDPGASTLDPGAGAADPP